MLRGKVCVITGGALGIGRCLTREFSKAGARVAFVDINNQAGKENEEYIKRNGGQVIFSTEIFRKRRPLRSLQI